MVVMMMMMLIAMIESVAILAGYLKHFVPPSLRAHDTCL